jgi:hypothetical protein
MPRRPGRPPCCPPEVSTLILDLRRKGLSYGQICIFLNAKQIPKPMGGSRWVKSNVVRILHTRYAREIIESHDNSA